MERRKHFVGRALVQSSLRRSRENVVYHFRWTVRQYARALLTQSLTRKMATKQNRRVPVDLARLVVHMRGRKPRSGWVHLHVTRALSAPPPAQRRLPLLPLSQEQLLYLPPCCHPQSQAEPRVPQPSSLGHRDRHAADAELHLQQQKLLAEASHPRHGLCSASQRPEKLRRHGQHQPQRHQHIPLPFRVREGGAGPPPLGPLHAPPASWRCRPPRLVTQRAPAAAASAVDLPAASGCAPGRHRHRRPQKTWQTRGGAAV